MQIEYKKGFSSQKMDCFCPSVAQAIMQSFCYTRVLVNALFTLTEGVGSTPRSIRLTLSIAGSKQ